MVRGSGWGVPPQILTIPPFAGPSDDQIIIGQSSRDGTVYPELAALYAPGVVVAAIIMQDSRFDYVYLAYVNPTVGLSFWAVGAIESVGSTLTESYRVEPGAFGADALLRILGRASIHDTATVESGANLVIASGGDIEVDSGGDINVNSGGDINVNSGGNVNVNSGGDLFVVGKQITGNSAWQERLSMNPGGTKSTGSFVNMPSPITSTAITKQYSGTVLKITMGGTFYVQNAQAGVEFGVSINGAGTQVVAMVKESNAAVNAHTTFMGIRHLTGIAAGSVTVQPRWARDSGTGIITMDVSDFFYMNIEEVSA